jgi:hypothetical protein
MTKWNRCAGKKVHPSLSPQASGDHRAALLEGSEDGARQQKNLERKCKMMYPWIVYFIKV